MKKIFCLISIVLFLAACTNDSTDTASQPASAPATSAEEPARQAVNQTIDSAQIYRQNCHSCHDSGLMGAPMLGNDRYQADFETLVENSINGIGMMPPRGGNASLSDDDVRAVVRYMVEQSQ